MQEQQQHTPPLYSKNLKTKSSTYFFDVKAAKNGSKYLVITQSSIKDGQKYRNNIFVFKDQAKDFSEIVNDMVEKVK